MLELLDKNMERVTITAFHIFKRLEKMFSTLNRDTKGTNKKIKLLEIKKLHYLKCIFHQMRLATD